MVRVQCLGGGSSPGGILGAEWRNTINSAALAMLHGVDPLTFLGVNRSVDRLVMDAALQRAEELYWKRQRDIINGIGDAVGAVVSRQLARMLG